MASDDWLRTMQDRPSLPLSGLLFALLLLGWLNSEFLAPYARPTLVSDEASLMAFYDIAALDDTSTGMFVFRETEDGELWSPQRRATGRLRDAELRGEALWLLFEGFVARYSRETRERKEIIDTTRLDFDPARLFLQGGELWLLGPSPSGDLLAAPIRDGRIGAAARLEAPAGAPEAKAVEGESGWWQPVPRVKERRELAKAPSYELSTAPVESQTLILLSAPQSPDDGSSAGLSRLVWTRFDGAAFAPPQTIDGPARAATLGLAGGAPTLYRVAEAGSTSVELWGFADGGFVKGETKSFEPGGWFRSQGITALAATEFRGAPVVVAQLGGALRICQASGDWQVLAQLTTETRTLLYGWFTAVLMLAGLLVLTGVQRFRKRPTSWPKMSSEQLDEELRHLVEISRREAARRARGREERDGEGRDGDEPPRAEASPTVGDQP